VVLVCALGELEGEVIVTSDGETLDNALGSDEIVSLLDGDSVGTALGTWFVLGVAEGSSVIRSGLVQTN